MLTYGGVPLVVATPELAARIEKAVSPRDTYGFERLDWPGVSRLAWGQPSMPPAPPVRVGVLHWPRDAMRWAVGYYLCTTNQLNKIRAQLAGGYAALPLVISQENEKRQTVQSITTSLWMLPPKPVWQITGRNGLYLLTLVDDRYWWQLRDTGEIVVTPGTTTWANLYSSLASALGITITADAISSAYLTPSVALTARYELSPMMLDCVAKNVGQHIVRDLDGTVYALSVTSSQTTIDANLATIGTSLVQPMAGGELAFNPGLSNDLASVLPGTVRLTFPQLSGGAFDGDVYPVSVTLASLALSDLGTVGNANIKTFHDSCAANGTGTPSNSAELTALTQQWATDWYRYQVAPYDGKLAGIVPWTLEGLSDSVEWVYRKHDVSTRIHRPPWNDTDEQLLHGSASAVPASVPPNETTFNLTDYTFIDNITWNLGIFNWTIEAIGTGSPITTGVGKQYENEGVLTLNTPVEICGVQFWCCYTVPTWHDPPYSTGYVNDWSVPNPATVYRISTDATSFDGDGLALSGIAAFNVAGAAYPQVIALVNVGANNIYLLDQDTHSAADNRFLLPNGMTVLKLKPKDLVLCWYDTCRKAATGTGAWIVMARGQSQVVTLNGLEGDVNLVAGANITITPSADTVDPRTITISATDTDTPPGANGGQNFLGGNATLTNVWASTGLATSSLAAGTYDIACDLMTSLQASLAGSQSALIQARLSTGGGAVTNSQRQISYVGAQESGWSRQLDAPLTMRVTLSGTDTITVQAQYVTGGTITTAVIAIGSSIRWTQVA